MAFNPSSTIYLCSVPFDNSYKNQVYFENINEQEAYFASRVLHTFLEYLTIRRISSDGKLVSAVKVNKNIDDLQNCNYMFYQNLNHGTRFYYAFITKLIYVNEGTTEIEFETDVFQTWFFDVTLRPSYVIREHSETDEIGENIVPEKFVFQDYTYSKIIDDDTLDKWGYLVGSTELNFETSSTSAGHLMSGIYQGLYFYYYENENELADFLAEFENDCIQFIAVVPKFAVSKNTIGANESDKEKGQGFIYSSADIAQKDINIDFTAYSFDFGTYTPSNNKLYTFPYFKLCITNHNGEEVEYAIEDFLERDNINFKCYGDISANPSITLYPCDYQGLQHNYDCGISISGFPQCSFNSDSFKLWLAKNQYGVALETAGNIGTIIAGIATTAGTGGAGSAIGVGMIASGASGVLSTINNVYQASKEPNKARVGASKNNLLTAIGFNKFDFYCKRIKEDYARTIDDFFTMYGYQTNKVKVPNISSRPCFNYVQTSDVNILGAIPADDMQRLRNVYNNGVTIWKKDVTMGDYSLDNSPK